MESATNATGKVAALRADESFFVRIHTNEVIHIIIRIHKVWFLYQFIQFFIRIVLRIHTTSL